VRVLVLLAAVAAAASIALVAVDGSPLGFARSRPAQGRVLDVPILLYHRIGRLPAVPTPISDALTVEPSVFDGQMEWLSRHRFHPISDRQLLRALNLGTPLPKRPVLITFDDGYADVLYNAAPVLHRLHWPATAFIITDRVGGPDPSFLTWAELRDLEQDGFTIGSHTVHHLDLTKVPPGQAWFELLQSRLTLERRLGRPVHSFAYPYGAENPAVVGEVNSAGYALAFTTRSGDVQTQAQRLLLRRYDIHRNLDLAQFAALLHSGT
jgi:peptidoglycan/xylan/chitin deacetylase (PgdA/CDA1 family)